MASHQLDGNLSIIAAAVLAVVVVIAFTGVVGHYTIKRSQQVMDEENKPLLSRDQPITMYDNDTRRNTNITIPNMDADVVPDVLSNGLSASPSVLSEGVTTTEEAPEHTIGRSTSDIGPSPRRASQLAPVRASPVSSPASQNKNAKAVSAKPIDIQQADRKAADVSKARLSLDGAIDPSKTVAAGSIAKANASSPSSFFDSFLPPQGLVQAMKAKLKSSAIPDNSKEARIIAEVNDNLIDLNHDEPQAVKLCTVSDEAKDVIESNIYDVKLGDHVVAPPGAFPTSPTGVLDEDDGEVKQTAATEVLKQAEVDVAAAKQSRKNTGSKLPKRRRQASRTEQTPINIPVPSVAPEAAGKPASKVRVVGSTHAQAAKEDQARRSSAPEPEESSSHGGTVASRSQRRRHARKKSHSVAAAMPLAEVSGNARKA